MWRYLIIAMAAYGAAGTAVADDYCDTARDPVFCRQYAEQDDEECSRFSGEKYGNCRTQLLMMHKMTGTPPGEVKMGDCALPNGTKVTMNVKTCKQQGGTVN